MDINKWFEMALPAVKDRIYKSTDKKMYFYCDKGALKSSFAYKDMSKIGMESISEEVRALLEKLSNLKNLKEKDWKEIETICNKFINDEYIEILKYCKEKTNASDTILDEENKKLKNEAVASLELNIEVQKQILNDKKNKYIGNLIWDIIKIILGGIIGSMLTLYLK